MRLKLRHTWQIFYLVLARNMLAEILRNVLGEEGSRWVYYSAESLGCRGGKVSMRSESWTCSDIAEELLLTF